MLFPLPIVWPNRLGPGRILKCHAGYDGLTAAFAATEVHRYPLDRRVPALALIEPPEPVAVEDLLVPASLAERLQMMPAYRYVVQCSDVPRSHAPRGTGRERFGKGCQRGSLDFATACVPRIR